MMPLAGFEERWAITQALFCAQDISGISHFIAMSHTPSLGTLLLCIKKGLVPSATQVYSQMYSSSVWPLWLPFYKNYTLPHPVRPLPHFLLHSMTCIAICHSIQFTYLVSLLFIPFPSEGKC